ncbi:MAG: trehalose-6-phosphate synthase [Actinobacteria bacterium]|nr:trehalose-6-phosphate synthase [Actinomycetota bacterium]
MARGRKGRTDRRLVIVANRLPVKRVRGAWRASAGGLVTALRPVIEEQGGAWIGWDGGAEDIPQRVEGFNADLHPVGLSRAQIQGYYHGFANRTLWPLFHDLIEAPIIDRRWWEVYRDVNHDFADATVKVDTDNALVWVHDYHLMLVPQLLRERGLTGPVGYFLHIPFPPPELVARLPWRDELLEGLLGADVVGFHTERYRTNFVDAVRRVVPDVAVRGRRLVLPDGRRVRTIARAISIDADEYAALATNPRTEQELETLRAQFEGRRVLLGIDRLDYTKGIRHRLQAIEQLLERRGDLRRSVAFVQVAVPSRDDVKEYRELREEVEYTIGRLNGRFTEPGSDVPVHYLYRSVPPPRLAAYYRLADAMLVTPLKDGMNLVAKEFVVVQNAAEGSGALVLSEFAGAALELDGALLCNPFDVEGLSLKIEDALALPEQDRRRRLQRMASRVHHNDVYAWVRAQLGELAEVS